MAGSVHVILSALSEDDDCESVRKPVPAGFNACAFVSVEKNPCERVSGLKDVEYIFACHIFEVMRSRIQPTVAYCSCLFPFPVSAHIHEVFVS